MHAWIPDEEQVAHIQERLNAIMEQSEKRSLALRIRHENTVSKLLSKWVREE